MKNSDIAAHVADKTSVSKLDAEATVTLTSPTDVFPSMASIAL